MNVVIHESDSFLEFSLFYFFVVLVFVLGTVGCVNLVEGYIL